jgi:signal transduction histidine kinase
MLELSKHILDIAENSIRAGCRTVKITVVEDTKADTLTLQISDDGKGMSDDEREKALDPFYTTKKVRRVGLGLPMLKLAAELADGSFRLDSHRGRAPRLP